MRNTIRYEILDRIHEFSVSLSTSCSVVTHKASARVVTGVETQCKGISCAIPGIDRIRVPFAVKDRENL